MAEAMLYCPCNFGFEFSISYSYCFTGNRRYVRWVVPSIQSLVCQQCYHGILFNELDTSFFGISTEYCVFHLGERRTYSFSFKFAALGIFVPSGRGHCPYRTGRYIDQYSTTIPTGNEINQ